MLAFSRDALSPPTPHPKSHWGPRALERARGSEEPLIFLEQMPYVHVDNLARAVVLAATRSAGEGEAYNVIDGTGPTRAYQEIVFSALGRRAPPLPPEPPDLRVPAQKIRHDLGYDGPQRWQEFLDELSQVG